MIDYILEKVVYKIDDLVDFEINLLNNENVNNIVVNVNKDNAIFIDRVIVVNIDLRYIKDGKEKINLIVGVVDNGNNHFHETIEDLIVTIYPYLVHKIYNKLNNHIDNIASLKL